jgi:C-terminal processing protease CtpA/Prc
MQLKKKLSLTRPRSRKAKGNQGIRHDECTPEVEELSPEQPVAEECNWSAAIENAFHSFADGVLPTTDTADDSNREAREAGDDLVRQKAPLDPPEKKKRFPLLASMKQKIKKNKQQKKEDFLTEAEVKEQLDIEEEPRSEPFLTYEQWEKFMDAVAFPEKSKTCLAIKEHLASQERNRGSEVRASEPVKEYLASQQRKQWEKFMDTVAFPEKSKTCLAINEYIASQERNRGSEVRASEPVKEYLAPQERNIGSEVRASEPVKEYLAPQERNRGSEVRASEHKITWEQYLSTISLPDITWEEFMDTCAFPEKIVGNKYQELLGFIASERVVRYRAETGIKNDKYLSLKEQRELPQDADITWEEFMDTCAFPEKILGNKYREILGIIASERVARYRAETGIKNDKYLSLKEQRELPQDADYATIYAMFKEKKKERLGIGITTVDAKEGLYISRLVPGSKGASSGLKVGLRIMSINKVCCPEQAQEAISLIASIEGDVKIFAQPGVSPSIFEIGMDTIEFGVISLSDMVFGDNKPNGHQVNNEGVEDDEDNEDEDDNESSLESSMDDYSSLGGTVDWEANSISAEIWEDPIENARKDKTEHARSASRRTKSRNNLSLIEEEHPAVKRVATIAFYIIKESQNETVGVSFVQSKDWPGVFVNHVAPTSKFSPTGLKKGMKIIRINGKACPMDLDRAIKIIQKIYGKLELTVEMEEDVVEKLNQDVCVVITITKKKDEAVSLKLQKDNRRGGLFVTDVNPFSKLALTELKPGHRIVSINGQRCPSDIDACLALMERVEGKLEIMAEIVPEQSLRLDG